MKILYLCLALLSGLAQAAPAEKAKITHQGGMDGGGGQGVLCEANGRRTLELLDLYEAKNIWGVSVPPSAEPRAEVKRIYRNYSLYADAGHFPEKIDPPPPPTEADVDGFLKVFSGDFERRLRPIPKGSRLNLSKDFTQPILQLPTHCQYVQIIYYVDENADTGQMLVDKDYWDLLSVQGKIALALHEEIYKMLRAFAERDSFRARRVIGLIFAEEEFPGLVRKTYHQADPQICWASMNEGYIFFLVIRHYDEWSKKELGRLLFKSLNLKGLKDRNLLVEHVGDSFFRFDAWKKQRFDPREYSGHEFFIHSALGSRMGRVSFANHSCKKDCEIELEVLSDENEWKGGKVECRPWRE